MCDLGSLYALQYDHRTLAACLQAQGRAKAVLLLHRTFLGALEVRAVALGRPFFAWRLLAAAPPTATAACCLRLGLGKVNTARFLILLSHLGGMSITARLADTYTRQVLLVACSQPVHPLAAVPQVAGFGKLLAPARRSQQRRIKLAAPRQKQKQACMWFS